jgi:hypothetical protein
MKFGKLAPRNDYRTLKMSTYSANLADPPVSFDNLNRVYNNLKVNDPSIVFPLDGNDKLGDCTICALAHADTLYNGLIGKRSILTGKAVIKIYKHLSGGTDLGLNVLDVLTYWRKTNVSGNKILAFVKIDPKNHIRVKQAIQLFGGVYFGFQVQQNAIKDFDSHTPWTPGKLLNEGHAVYATSYDVDKVTVLTWGATQDGTWDWWDQTVDEAYAILPAEAQNLGFAPGFDFAQLQSDLKLVTN